MFAALPACIEQIIKTHVGIFSNHSNQNKYMLLTALREVERNAFIRKIHAFISGMPFKTIAIMKITLILLFAFCIKVNANGFAQQISLSEKNAPLKKIFKQIQQQSGYHFLYTD